MYKSDFALTFYVEKCAVGIATLTNLLPITRMSSAVPGNGPSSGDDPSILEVLHGGGLHVEASGGADHGGGEPGLGDGDHLSRLGHEHCLCLHVVPEVGADHGLHDLAGDLHERCLYVLLSPGLHLGLHHSRENELSGELGLGLSDAGYSLYRLCPCLLDKLCSEDSGHARDDLGRCDDDIIGL